jgi:hypothetical protein
MTGLVGSSRVKDGEEDHESEKLNFTLVPVPGQIYYYIVE